MFPYFLFFGFAQFCLSLLKKLFLLFISTPVEAIMTESGCSLANVMKNNSSLTMNNLSNQIKLDIFKCLNVDELIVIQNVSRYFYNFVDDYRNEFENKKIFSYLLLFLCAEVFLLVLAVLVLLFKTMPEEMNKTSKWILNKVMRNKAATTMNNLSNEIKLDIFKCLNFEQLIKIQNVNRFFNKFFEDYRNELALEYISEIKILHKLVVKHRSIKNYTELNADRGVDNFSLSDELKKKWEFAIFEQIPLYLSYNEPCKAVVRFCNKKGNWLLKLTYIPKNIKEMFIIRFWLKKFLNCTFAKAEFDNVIFNPALIKLLFENVRNLLQFHTNNTLVRYCITNFENQAMKFVKDHLVICTVFNVDFTLCDDLEQCNKPILNILKEGKKFPYVKIIFRVGPSLFELIKNYLKTSTNCSNFVSKVEFEVTQWGYVWNVDYLRNMADETSDFIHDKSHLFNSKYKIVNNNDPKIVFLANYMWRASINYIVSFIIKRK